MKQNQFDIKLDQSYKNKIEQSEQLIGESMKKVKKEEKCERKKNKITKNILNMIDEAIEE